MKFVLALLIVVVAALPARTAPVINTEAGVADKGTEDQTGAVPQKGREKKSYREGKDGAQVAAAVPCAGGGLGHGGIGLSAGQGLLAPYPYGGYYGLRPWGYGGVGLGGLGGGIGYGLGGGVGGGVGGVGGGGAHYRSQTEQRGDVTGDHQWEMRAAAETKTQENQAEARTHGGFGFGGHGGFGGGALGVFPGAVGGCGGIPLLVSCTPSLVAGHIVSGGHGFGGFGQGGWYRSADESNKMEQQKVIPPAPPAAPGVQSLAHHKVSSSFQQRQASSSLHHVGSSSAGKLNSLSA